LRIENPSIICRYSTEFVSAVLTGACCASHFDGAALHKQDAKVPKINAKRKGPPGDGPLFHFL